MWLTIFTFQRDDHGITRSVFTVFSSEKVRTWSGICLDETSHPNSNHQPQESKTSSILGVLAIMKPSQAAAVRIWDFKDANWNSRISLECGTVAVLLHWGLGASRISDRSLAPPEVYAFLFIVDCVLCRSVMGGDAVISILTERYRTYSMPAIALRA